MPVKDEIVGKSSREVANIKAQRHAGALPSMARPYTRNGYRFTIDDFGAEERNGVVMLKLVATVRQAPNGPVIIAASDPINPMYFINPPIMVRDGGTDAAPTYREDLIEALRQMLDLKLAEKLRA